LLLWATGNLLPAQPAPRQVTHQSFIWYSLMHTYAFSPRWTLTTDLQERTFLSPMQQAQFGVRLQLTHTLSPSWAVGQGFAYFRTRPGDPNSAGRLAVPEWRPYQHVQFSHTGGKLRIGHRLRIEERFIRKNAQGKLEKGFNYAVRYRYALLLSYPLYASVDNTHTITARAHNEVFLQTGANIAHLFDQNRLYGGIQYAPSPAFSVELGFFKMLQQRSAPGQFYDRSTIRATVVYTAAKGRKE